MFILEKNWRNLKRWICTGVYVAKLNLDVMPNLYCVVNTLPLSHVYPLHPASQPPSHRPVSWLHVALLIQCPIHVLLQYCPYHPYAQPPSHWPVTWLQKSVFKQCPTHRCVQFRPYHPPAHPVITYINCILLSIYICSTLVSAYFANMLSA